jgi:pantoate--beta-alanine ligase
VATVVLKLLNLVRPQAAYFGQKDYQQTVVIRRMVEDLAVPCAIEVVPTVREADGLALSSRNVYLSVEERRAAPALYRGLCAMAELLETGERRVSALCERGRQLIEEPGLAGLEYLEVVSGEALEPLEQVEGPAVALVAARLGRTRLIDNAPLQPSLG